MIKIDLHIHTIVSGHAFNTIDESAKIAAEKKMEYIGFAEHGPAMPGAPVKLYFRASHLAPRELYGVQIRYGIEANIINSKGDLDLDEKTLKKLDYVIAGLHIDGGFEPQGKKKETEATIAALNNPLVKMISHPYWSLYDVDIEAVAEEACRLNKMLELNSSYFYKPIKNFDVVVERIKKMVSVYKKHGKKLLINSDAHSALRIGNDKEIRKYFNELGLTEADIMNNDVEAVKKFFNFE